MNPLRSWDCAVRDFVRYCTCRSKERKVGKGIEGVPEKCLSGLESAFGKNAVTKKTGTMSKATAYFFCVI